MANEQHVDFIAVYLKDGKISFAFNCGSGMAQATTTLTYNDNFWHTVRHCLPSELYDMLRSEPRPKFTDDLRTILRQTYDNLITTGEFTEHL